MGSVRANKNRLFFDLRIHGQRVREYTALPDTPKNRRLMDKMLSKIQAEITFGTFDYGKYFPGSKNASKFAAIGPANDNQATETPRLAEFAETWPLNRSH